MSAIATKGSAPAATGGAAPAVTAEECPECLASNLIWLLKQAHYGLASELATAFEPLGLTPRTHFVLSAAMTGTHTQKQLADLVGLDKTTMVVTLDELEAAGLARRVPSPGDRRARVVEVTKAGERKVQEANLVAKRVQEDVLTSLELGTAEGLLEGLAELVRVRLAEPSVCSKAIRRREPRPASA